jgi:hypothetical protein
MLIIARLRYAIAMGKAERNISSDLRGALPPTRKRHHATIVDPKKISELLKAIQNYEGYFVTKCALQLAPLIREAILDFNLKK